MTQNLVMARTQLNFRLDDWLKEELDQYCDTYGLKKERFIEALVFGAVVKRPEKLPPAELFTWIQELAQRSSAGGGEPPVPPSVLGGVDQAIAKESRREREKRKRGTR